MTSIRNGTFDKMMQSTAEGKHSEKRDYLAPPSDYGYKPGDLTTLEKDMDHPSPKRNPNKSYSASEPTNKAV